MRVCGFTFEYWPEVGLRSRILLANRILSSSYPGRARKCERQKAQIIHITTRMCVWCRKIRKKKKKYKEFFFLLFHRFGYKFFSSSSSSLLFFIVCVLCIDISCLSFLAFCIQQKWYTRNNNNHFEYMLCI